jgi:hypothetical protein
MARRQLRAMCTHSRQRLTISDAPDPAGASTDRSNRRRRLLAAFRKRAGLACVSAKFESICNLFRDAESGCNPRPLSRRQRPRLKREKRRIVPATSFCEYENTKPCKTPTWFALNDDRPLFAFRRALDPLGPASVAREACPSRGANTTSSDFSRWPMRP